MGKSLFGRCPVWNILVFGCCLGLAEGQAFPCRFVDFSDDLLFGVPPALASAISWNHPKHMHWTGSAGNHLHMVGSSSLPNRICDRRMDYFLASEILPFDDQRYQSESIKVKYHRQRWWLVIFALKGALFIFYQLSFLAATLFCCEVLLAFRKSLLKLG